MRTTLQLDDDVLAAARVLARQRRVSLGEVISELARRGLVTPPPSTGSTGADSLRQRNGVPLLPWTPHGSPVDLDLVNRLRDDAP